MKFAIGIDPHPEAAHLLLKHFMEIEVGKYDKQIEHHSERVRVHEEMLRDHDVGAVRVAGPKGDALMLRIAQQIPVLNTIIAAYRKRNDA